MKSEEEIIHEREFNNDTIEPYQLLLLNQLSDSELKEISDKVVQQNSDFVHMHAKRTLKYLEFSEYQLRMSKREHLIYQNGVILGRKAALDWVLDDTDFIHKYDWL